MCKNVFLRKSGMHPIELRNTMIEPDEILLAGKWSVEGTKIVADQTTQRIEVLLSEHLTKVIASVDGWSQLYRDPNDGRLWQLS
jgi:hypothetical protein